LENTYVVFWTDNGHHMGEHRLRPGKQTPYEEDVRFPLVVRGPGVPQGAERPEMLLNTDVGPTFAELAGTQPPGFVDGRSFAPLLRGKNPPWRSAVLLEGPASNPRGQLQMPGYRAVRTHDRLYVEWATGERELYDLGSDPYQLRSQHDNRAFADEQAALEARVEALKGCAAETCRAAEGGSAP
jgi:N-acetylglucosamine-6-sulfatase